MQNNKLANYNYSSKEQKVCVQEKFERIAEYSKVKE